MSDSFMAEIRIFPYTFAPRDWAHCNGLFLSTSQFPALFSLLGLTFGGNGRTTFKLPDLQGRAPLHWGAAPGLSPHSWGEMGGKPQVVLTESEIPPHNHQMTAAFGHPGTEQGYGAYLANEEDFEITPYKQPFDGDNQVEMAAATIGVSGGMQPHENRQPYLAVPFCICLMGVYPSRN